MHPSKSMMDDYIMELNRLFPKTSENDAVQTSHTYSNIKVFHSPTLVNHSSSSTDSTSPESVSDFPAFITSFSNNFRPFPDNVRPFSNTSTPTPNPVYTGRGHRAIVGRKVVENIEPIFETPKRSYDFEIMNPTWQPIDSVFSPQSPHTSTFEMHSPQKVLYELFPESSDNREFRTPVKSSPSSSSFASPSTSNMSPVSPKFSSPVSNVPVDFSGQLTRSSASNFGSNSSFNSIITSTKVCTFCRKNGEAPCVYANHLVKENIYNRTIVTCPILRSLVCPTCGVSGDNAHTITYCPVLRNRNNGVPLQSTTITLKNTRIKSNGKRRY